MYNCRPAQSKRQPLWLKPAPHRLSSPAGGLIITHKSDIACFPVEKTCCLGQEAPGDDLWRGHPHPNLAALDYPSPVINGGGGRRPVGVLHAPHTLTAYYSGASQMWVMYSCWRGRGQGMGCKRRISTTTLFSPAIRHEQALDYSSFFLSSQPAYDSAAFYNGRLPQANSILKHSRLLCSVLTPERLRMLYSDCLRYANHGY